MSIHDDHRDLIDTIATALREAGYTRISQHHAENSSTIAGHGKHRDLVVQVLDPASVPEARSDGRRGGAVSASPEPPRRAVHAVAAGIEPRHGSSGG
jgi:hypothetical protein